MGLAASAAALATTPAPALAQDSAAPLDAPAPATANAVGPEQLRDFSLKGTVTRRAEPEAIVPTRQAQPATRTGTGPPPATAQQTRQAPAPAGAEPPPAALAGRPPAPGASLTFDLPPVAGGNPATPAPVRSPASGIEPAALPEPDPAAGAALTDSPSSLPWLLLVMLAALAGGYNYFRQRSRLAYAGTEIDIVSPRVPAPAAPPLPVPAPAPRPLERVPSPPGAGGIVASSLRPWIDFALVPKRVIRAEDGVTLEFDIELFNSGGAVARDIELSAALFTANPAQDQEIAAFFAHPPAAGEPMPLLPPLKRLTMSSSVALGNDQLKLFQIDGRVMFVPLVAISARYRGSAGEAQTAVSYVIGRDTGGEKLGALRADLGPRVFRKLGIRQHDSGVRR